MPRQISPTVLVACDEPELSEEIVRYLEEIPGWILVGSARSLDELRQASASDAVLLSDALASQLAVESPDLLGRSHVVVIGRRETSDALKAALWLGARGFVNWPAERRTLRKLVETGLRDRGPATQLGALTSLWAPKGGSGTSVLAAHLAGAIAPISGCVLVDLDLDHSDQSVILGSDSDVKGALDLLRIVDEISADAIQGVSWTHPAGFRAILSRGAPGESDLVKSSDIVKMLQAIHETADHVVVDLPSGYGESVLAVAEIASRLLLVVTPDLLSLHRARDAMAMLRSAGIDSERIEVLLNQYSGGDVRVGDVEGVLGRPVIHKVKPDAGLFRCAGRGELSQRGTKQMRALATAITGPLSTP